MKTGEPIDYLTIVSDGEPTLDANLGRMIELLRPLGIKIAVITNASLIWREDVRSELKKADWVSLKVDSVGKRFGAGLIARTITCHFLQFWTEYVHFEVITAERLPQRQCS